MRTTPNRSPRLPLIAALVAAGLIASPARAQQEGRGRDADAILDDLGREAFRWFEANRHPQTGLVRDRSPNRKGRGQASAMASIASVGYFLSLLPEAVRTRQIGRDEAEAQAALVLGTMADKAEGHDGLFYHFIDRESGKRWDKSEVSLLDSAILFNGAMVAGQSFGGEVAERADALLDRADWTKFLVRDTEGRPFLSLGWKPEEGLLVPADVRSSEMAMPYFLAVGSRTHPIDPECWFRTRLHSGEVAGRKVLNPEHPLFTSYYGLGWHDLRGKADRDGVDFWANAREAALGNRAFCRAMAAKFRTYAESEGGWWGISAGDAPGGYTAPGPDPNQVDGTVWPTATLAAWPWAEEVLRRDLLAWRASRNWDRAHGDYGLAPFNLDKGWVGDDVIGIDLGSFALNLANARARTAWDLWARHPVGRAALDRLGYRRD